MDALKRAAISGVDVRLMMPEKSDSMVVGAANMDIRSFDLNFEIMSVDYGASLANELETAFLNDMKECREISSEEWNS